MKTYLNFTPFQGVVRLCLSDSTLGMTGVCRTKSCHMSEEHNFLNKASAHMYVVCDLFRLWEYSNLRLLVIVRWCENKAYINKSKQSSSK